MKTALICAFFALLMPSLHANDELKAWKDKIAADIPTGTSRQVVEKYLKEHKYKYTYLPKEALINALLLDYESTMFLQKSLALKVNFDKDDKVTRIDVSIERMGL